ncbi:hypothetical protein BH23GEM2_BH23GEM2_23450 [soil metagenome]
MGEKWLDKALAKTGSPRRAARALHAAERHAERASFMVGQMHSARVADLTGVTSLAQVEFGVYSQWGEDGIIDYLTLRTEIPRPFFVEFGVEDYREANTRFLLRNRNWSGLVMDGSDKHVNAIRADPLYETNDIQAVAAFVTAENINELISAAGVSGDIGLLSIDIDGNDYWVWKALEVISPRIVVCEYNSLFGDTHAVTVPYDPVFDRRRAHHSTLYFGASLTALRDLAADKGYAFVGCNSAGGNAFFVRNDCAGPFAALQQSAGFVAGKFRESRSPDGARTFLSGSARQMEIADCVVTELRQGRRVRLRELSPSLI